MSLSQISFQFPEVRVVEASAGSGKTFALAKRYVQLILDPRISHPDLPIRSVLAITFMKKASFEMKQRILLFLKKIALKTVTPAEAQEILGAVGLDVDEASPRAFVLMDQLIHHYNFFQVQTIDSFINALLSGCAYKIGLSARFKIKHNPFDYLQYSLDRLIERCADEPDMNARFARFLNQYLLLENKSSWFPKKDILGLMSALFHQRNSYGIDFVLHESGEIIFAQMGRIISLMNDLKEILPPGTHSRFADSLRRFLADYTHAFDFDRVSDYFQKEEFPVKKGEDVPDRVRTLWDEIRMSLRRLAESEAYALFSPYVELFQELIHEFNRKAARDDILFMEELNRRARFLFDEGGVTVEELYYRLATRFRHYLVDEFQDTSRLQWQNLVLMVEEALSTGGSLFYVGDKKQAIYGFRGGEVRLFDQVKQDFRHFHVQIEHLTTNYRSSQSIVEFNNRLFSRENLERFIGAREERDAAKKGSHHSDVRLGPEDRQRLMNVFDHSTQTSRAQAVKGYVQVEYIDGDRRQKRDEEVRERLLALLGELRKRFSWKDVAILTRKNAEVQAVTGWLMEQGIPVKSERTLNIKENLVVRELVAFLTFLNSPIDNVAFADVILGEVFACACGLSRDQIRAFMLAQRGMRHQHKSAVLYREFRSSFPEQWSRAIEPFFKTAGLYPLYEFFVSILQEWQVLSHFQEQAGFIMRLLEVIKKYEEEGCDLAGFLAYYDGMQHDELFVHVADSDSVEIVTVHKAKGLQYPVVILPFAAMEIQVGQKGGLPGEELGQRSYILNAGGSRMELLRIKKDYLAYSPLLYEIYRQQVIDSLLSELNSIYVGFTRSEAELYVFIPAKAGNSENLLRLFVPDDVSAIGELGKKRAPGAKEQVKTLSVVPYEDWMVYLREEFSADAELLTGRIQLRRGKALHAMLSAVGNICHDEIESVLDAGQYVLRSQVRYGIAENDIVMMRAALKELLSQDHLRPFFYVEDGVVFQEKEIVDQYGHLKRLDRLIVRTSEVIVVDYKSTRSASGAHDAQVRDYMNVVGRVYPGRAVKGYLLYLDDFGLEEVAGKSV